ncbi:TerD family protein [Acinetobacter sp. P1(2025)]|uniref:TerD family protein n=1 Tax=Acinetobacter sp. P1(2025) TaxID=3446120 RepID=UPI003F52C0E9
MAISLSKGGNISLTKEAPTLVNVLLGLGWDARVTDGAAYDLDASAFLLGANGKARSDSDFIFYGQKASADGSVVHQGDNRTGDGDGDDEQIKIDLSKVPADVTRIVLTVTIHDAAARNQNFGQIKNAFIRVVNDADNTEIVRYDLSEDYSLETALEFGEIYRHGSEWKFKALGQGYSGGLAAMCAQFGINAA